MPIFGPLLSYPYPHLLVSIHTNVCRHRFQKFKYSKTVLCMFAHVFETVVYMQIAYKHDVSEKTVVALMCFEFVYMFATLANFVGCIPVCS